MDTRLRYQSEEFTKTATVTNEVKTTITNNSKQQDDEDGGPFLLSGLKAYKFVPNGYYHNTYLHIYNPLGVL